MKKDWAQKTVRAPEYCYERKGDGWKANVYEGGPRKNSWVGEIIDLKEYTEGLQKIFSCVGASQQMTMKVLDDVIEMMGLE